MPRLKNLRLLSVVIIVLFFSSWKIGVNNIMEWDEARNAVNAYEMYYNGDYINLHYGGEPDTWNAKPPLFTWIVLLCYKAMGFNEFALRLPSVLSALVFFVYFYRIVRMKGNDTVAFVSCLVLLGCNSIVAQHMGITGDYDALLLCFLTIATFHFIRFADLGHRSAIYLCAFFLGLAFYTKGTAALVYIPAWIVYVGVTGKTRAIFTSRHTWGSVLLFLVIALSWVALVMIFGKTTGQSFYGSKNSIETMLVHDTFRRLTSKDFGEQPDNTFVFSTLDSKMSMWIYVFYALVAADLIRHFRKTGSTFFVYEKRKELQMFSWSVILTLAFILALATNKHWWYLAPAFPYVAVIIASGILNVSQRWRWARYVFGAFIVFTLGWHFRTLNNIPTDKHHLLGMNSGYWQGPEKVLITHRPKQDIFLYVTWSGKEMVYVDEPEKLTEYTGQLTILDIEDVTPGILDHLSDITYFDAHLIARIK